MFSGCVAGLIFVENKNSIIIERITDCVGKIFVFWNAELTFCKYVGIILWRMRRRQNFLIFYWIFTQTYLKFGQVGNFWAQKSDKSEIFELKKLDKSDKSGKVGQIFKKSEKLAKSDNYEAWYRQYTCIHAPNKNLLFYDEFTLCKNVFPSNK